MRGSAAFRTGVAPGGALAGPWTRNPLWASARAVPSLDLRFAENKSLTDATTGQNLVTFTRASSGTYVGSDGVLRTAVTNLRQWSEEFDNASWTKVQASITLNATTAPNGTLTADALIENTTPSTGHQVTQNVTYVTGKTYTHSCYFKLYPGPITRYARLQLGSTTVFGTDVYANINLATGTVINTPGLGATASVTNAGNGWYRASITLQYTGAGVTTGPAIQIVSTGGSALYTDADGLSGIYIWGAQWEESATVGEYIPTTSAINSAPRFDHNPTTGESLGLLVEEQRANSIRNNTMVGAVAGTPGTLPTNWTIGGGGLGTLSQQVIGVGSIGSLSYIDVRYSGTTSTTGFIFAFEPSTQIAALTGQSWTSSFYIALISGSTTNINSLRHDIVERTSAGGTVLQNFSADFKSSLTSNLIRTTYSLVLSGGATTAFAQPSIEFGFNSGVAIDITLRIGLPQLEQGAFATSVIPTTTTALTRSADVASITGSNFSSWYRQDEGTVFAETLLARQNAVPGAAMAGIETGVTNAEAIYMHYRASGATAATIYDNAAIQIDQSPYNSAVPANTGVRQAIAFRLNDSSSSGGGSSQVTDTACTLPTPDRMLIGFSTAGSAYLSGTIRRLTYWPVRLGNNVLQQITQ
jgi:hypothetical protein